MLWLLYSGDDGKDPSIRGAAGRIVVVSLVTQRSHPHRGKLTAVVTCMATSQVGSSSEHT